MTNYERMRQHYGQQGLAERLCAALREAGLPESGLTPEQTAAFDQLHTGGLNATRALAKFGALSADMRVLDLGCGLGGPARALAAEFGCTVTGIDLTADFIDAARALTAMSTAGDRVQFDTGDMLDLPYEDEAFDVIWSQNVTMNIADKHRLLRQIGRVVKPGGRYVFQEVFEGSGEPIHLPTPWATEADQSFLVSPLEFFKTAEANGWRVVRWKDNSEEALLFQHERLKTLESEPNEGAPVLTLKLVMGPTLRQKRENSLRNLEEGRVRVGHGVMLAE